MLFRSVSQSRYPSPSEFALVAQNVQQYLGTDDHAIIAKMDPPMFFFDADSFRALKIIPKLAQDLPEKHTTIDWPASIVSSIEKKSLVQITNGGKTYNSHPVGYFKTDTGEMTNDISKAVGAFMVLEVGQNLYEQEILMEPEWMSSSTGIINILQACLGDLYKLVGLSILDPITETVILHSYNTAKNIPITQTPISQAAEQMITGLQQHRANKDATSTAISTAQQNGTISIPSAAPSTAQASSQTSVVSTPSTESSKAQQKKSAQNTAQSAQQIILPHANFLPTLPEIVKAPSAPSLVPSLKNIISVLSSSGASVLPTIISGTPSSSVAKNISSTSTNSAGK